MLRDTSGQSAIGGYDGNALFCVLEGFAHRRVRVVARDVDVDRGFVGEHARALGYERLAQVVGGHAALDEGSAHVGLSAVLLCMLPLALPGFEVSPWHMWAAPRGTPQAVLVRQVAEGMREAKAEGLPVTVETCPHYLCLTAEQIPEKVPELAETELGVPKGTVPEDSDRDLFLHFKCGQCGKEKPEMRGAHSQMTPPVHRGFRASRAMRTGATSVASGVFTTIKSSAPSQRIQRQLRGHPPRNAVAAGVPGAAGSAGSAGVCPLLSESPAAAPESPPKSCFSASALTGWLV